MFLSEWAQIFTRLEFNSILATLPLFSGRGQTVFVQERGGGSAKKSGQEKLHGAGLLPFRQHNNTL
jgi:hypothetical protein